ncbi:MAG: TIGR00730 family Rossman fold protein [Bacteroidota bacterium]
MNRLSVFCGSSTGQENIYSEQAYMLGKTLAREKIGLVYGGTKVGLMGRVADGVLDHGGEAVGVLPRFLQEKEIAHDNLTRLHLVNTLHERKALMNTLSNGAIALPGGFGTMEEFFEMLTWAQLQLHLKPVALLNINGYYDALIRLFDHMVNQGFLKQVNRNMVLSAENIDDLLTRMRSYQAPAVGKWIG